MHEDIFFQEQTGELVAAGNHRIDELLIAGSIDEKTAGVMRVIVDEAKFGAAYTQWLLTDDWREFRTNLPHNQHFIREADQFGINLPVYFSGIDFEPYVVPTEIVRKGAFQSNEALHNKILGHLEEGDRLVAEFNKKVLEVEGYIATSVQGYRDLLEENEKENRKLEDAIHNFELENPGLPLPDSLFDRISARSPERSIDEQALEEKIEELQKTLEEHNFEQYAPDEDVLGYAQRAQDPSKEYTERTRDLNDYLEKLVDNIGSIHNVIDWLGLTQPESSSFILGTEGPMDSMNALLRELVALSHVTYNLAEDNTENHSKHSTPANLKKVLRDDTITYSIEPELLLPTDVHYGRDGGCCQGIHGQMSETNNTVPMTMLDLGQQVHGIYLLRGSSKKRVGITLNFASVDAHNYPVLAVNSIELSSMNNPASNEVLDPFVDYIVAYLNEYAKQAGFHHSAMGRTSYNTSVNYGSKSTNYSEPDFETDEITKLPDVEYPEFYQEFFNYRYGGYSTGRTFFWMQRNLQEE